MQFTAKTFFGLESILAEELKNIGAQNIEIGKRAVHFTGGNEILYKANYLLRTAIRVLWELETFTVNTTEELYDKVKKIEWDNYLTQNKTFAIDKTIFSKLFTHSHYAALKAKDAIADYFAEKYDERPSVDVDNPDIKINLYIGEDVCKVSIDTSEPALFKRAYRKQTDIAPINEVLAAGMILLSDYKKKKHIYDPMCGSGTILIEAAYICYNIPAGYRRRSYAFQKLRNYEPDLWAKVKSEADANIKSYSNITISGSDASSQAIRIARGNIANAFLSSKIKIKIADALRVKSPSDDGIIITNPPYDERIKKDNIEGFYNDFGRAVKRNFKGWDINIISANLPALKNIGLRYNKSIELYNGKLKSFYNTYELFKPSPKKKRRHNF